MTGYAPEKALGRNCRFLQGADRDQPALEDLRAALREGETRRVVLRNYKRDGALFYNELTVSPVSDEGGRIVRFVGVLEDITERRRVEDALHVQAEASEILATPLSYEERLVGLARLVVPRLADWCAVDVVAEDGFVRRIAVEHEDPEKVALAYELQRRYPTPAGSPRGVRRVLETGEPEMVGEIPDEFLAKNVRDGRGFDPGALPPGVGTLGMHERALALGGRLEVESEPGAGTTVRFVAPLGNLRR